MPKQKPGFQKFSSALYCASWPAGQYLFLGGGGGKKSSGIPNRLEVVCANGEQLAEPSGSLSLGNDAPMRSALHPSGRSLLLAMGNGGLQRIAVRPQLPSPPDVYVEDDGLAEQIPGTAIAQCLRFSDDGRFVGMGFTDGSVQVLEWPSLRCLLHLKDQRGMRDALRDVDFSPAHRNRILAATAEDGTGALWHWERGQPVASLELPPELKGGQFNRVRFARDGSMALYTAVNCKGVGWLLHWAQSPSGDISLLSQRTCGDIVTAFDISPSGHALAIGHSEGEVKILATEKLVPLCRVKRAHTIFVTAITFAQDGKAVVSTSADATARVTVVEPPNGRSGASSKLSLAFLLAFIAVLLAVGVQIFRQWQSGDVDLYMADGFRTFARRSAASLLRLTSRSSQLASRSVQQPT
ncbi:hypothetical protein WJX74_003654 [Apatococcus lobatus]|uniref:Uncharacterized protein n=1 Tax=Apatococcus lobatus TaxID=904363 RepID=A0AAW1SE25_9CHLO